MKSEKLFYIVIDTVRVCLALVLLWAVWYFYGTRVWGLVVVLAILDLVQVGLVIVTRCSKYWEIHG